MFKNLVAYLHGSIFNIKFTNLKITMCRFLFVTEGLIKYILENNFEKKACKYNKNKLIDIV